MSEEDGSWSNDKKIAIIRRLKASPIVTRSVKGNQQSTTVKE